MPVRSVFSLRHSLALVVAALPLACRLAESAASREPLQPTATSITADPARPASPTPSPQPSPTAPPRDCPTPDGNPELPEARAAAIVGYLNQGGTPQELGDHLAGQVAELDFDGDGWLDLGLTANLGTEGGLFIFRCDGQVFDLAYAGAELPTPGPATIHASQDLTGDQLDDLLVSLQQCGAHTCVAQVEVLTWTGSRLANRLRGAADDLPTPRIEWQPTQSGAAAIRVTATGIGSIGAGPFRMQQRSWLWDSDQQAFLAEPDELLPSDYRIHRLHDADDAAAAGDLEQALDLYQQVIGDASLDDWASGEVGHQQLAAYASFRSVLTLLQLGDLEPAEQALAELQLQHPPATPGAGFAALGEAFWAAFASANGGARPPAQAALEAGCRAARAFSASHSEQTIDLLYYGYANRTYSAKSICPFGE